ncbi:hypothetical protein V6N13_127507, partial [Hibiscus sabdariffa]
SISFSAREKERKTSDVVFSVFVFVSLSFSLWYFSLLPLSFSFLKDGRYRGYSAPCL